jgi:hypothetical protein
VNSSTGAVIAVVVLAIAVLVVLAAGFSRPTMVEIESSTGDTAVPVPAPGEARVRGAGQESGVSLFGLTLGGSTTLNIEIPVSRDCFDTTADGDTWPSEVPDCASDLPVEGAVTRHIDEGSSGPALVVKMKVSKDCYSVAADGARWPTGLSECATEEAAATR